MLFYRSQFVFVVVVQTIVNHLVESAIPPNLKNVPKKAKKCTIQQYRRSKCRNDAECYYIARNSTSSTREIFTCVCPLGYLDATCSTYSCKKHNPCFNRGKCKKFKNTTHAGATCICHDGFTGSRCEDVSTNSKTIARPTCVEGKKGKPNVTCVHGLCVNYESRFFTYTKYESEMTNQGLTWFDIICWCKHGYEGLQCTKKCSPGEYGYYCSRWCDVGCKNRECHFKSGTCSKGCDKAYTNSPECDIRRRCKKASCVHGKCATSHSCVCSPGYFGLACDQTCKKKRSLYLQLKVNTDKYYYGSNCNFECSAFCFKQPCDSKTGRCKKYKNRICKEPWTGPYCNTTARPLSAVDGGLEINDGATDFVVTTGATILDFVDELRGHVDDLLLDLSPDIYINPEARVFCVMQLNLDRSKFQQLEAWYLKHFPYAPRNMFEPDFDPGQFLRGLDNRSIGGPDVFYSDRPPPRIPPLNTDPPRVVPGMDIDADDELDLIDFDDDDASSEIDGFEKRQAPVDMATTQQAPVDPKPTRIPLDFSVGVALGPGEGDVDVSSLVVSVLKNSTTSFKSKIVPGLKVDTDRILVTSVRTIQPDSSRTDSAQGTSKHGLSVPVIGALAVFGGLSGLLLIGVLARRSSSRKPHKATIKRSKAARKQTVKRRSRSPSANISKHSSAGSWGHVIRSGYRNRDGTHSSASSRDVKHNTTI